MSRTVLTFTLGMLLIAGGSSLAIADDDASSLPRSTPEQQGIASGSILGFVDAADSQLDSLHSFMLVRHGNVVAEGWWTPYNPESRHELYSLSKSFTSTAVGLAIAEGKMTLDDLVLDAFPEDAPANPSTNLKSMRVRDLLRMSAGHESETGMGAAVLSPKTFLAQPVPFKPGTHFKYNTPATFMASAMVQKAVGQPVFEYLKPRLFEPLGITNPTWDTNFQGINLGGYGLSVRTEDIAKFGQLYLQKGQWKGKQLVPAEWVEQATKLQTSNGSNPKSDWDQGYGYQFWQCRNGAYRGDGAFGQFCVVIPEQDAVVAITSGLNDLQGVLNLVWEKILPGLQAESISENPEAHQQLQSRLKGLTIRKPKGPATSPILGEVAGKTYAFPANERKVESARIEPGSKPGELTIILKTDGQEQRIETASDEWKKGTYSVPQGGNRAALAPKPGDKPVASFGAWVADDTYEFRTVLIETPFVRTTRLKFDGEELTLDSFMNAGGKEPQLVGRRQ
ncbi:serine hydrolase domain-containing protein [Tundrisphaera lichenicola]|uniref:serine hydrolase domain-containing protein n=1 Tax=Tundrisphaera lichenicola TaxID=2029860 RepID=UPI003EC118E4